MLNQLAATVADMQDVNRFIPRHEEYPINMWCEAVEQLAHFEREDRAFWS